MPDETNKTNIEPKNNTNHFPGADVSIDDQVTSEQMELPGNNEYQAPVAKFKTKKSFRPTKKLWFSAAIFGIVVIACIIVWLLIPSKDQQPNNMPKQASSGNVSTANGEEMESGSIDLSESHVNDFLRLSFKYPENWEVSDENDVILVKSPSFTYRLADGSETEGFFKLYIKQQAASADGEYLGRGYSIGQSQKLTYSDPQPGQRADTFLTNFGLDETDNFAYFVVQGVFNLKPGETLGPKYANEPDAYLIAGGFGAAGLEAPLATSLLPADSYASEIQYKTALEIVKSLQLR